ncbi:glutamate dehydrogenase [Anopheles sinensis]|uniref:Glutamate dehydrogenase n=1 Tax=Anopheles sinensis TaxID=74873 RepID=A0A084VWD4_ANOSI|nr:glutamate dehydrogenase [Anopheles sinensis]
MVLMMMMLMEAPGGIPKVTSLLVKRDDGDDRVWLFSPTRTTSRHADVFPESSSIFPTISGRLRVHCIRCIGSVDKPGTQGLGPQLVGMGCQPEG